jgi:hypothetical protein
MAEWPERFDEDHFKTGRFPRDRFRIAGSVPDWYDSYRLIEPKKVQLE